VVEIAMQVRPPPSVVVAITINGETITIGGE
jgi:hypothetical protein